MIVSAGWVAAILWYYNFADAKFTWGYAAIAFCQCACFWCLCKGALFARPLFVASAISLTVNLLATVMTLEHWWTVFLLNRLFELSLLYIATCALYRIAKKHGGKRKSAPAARSSNFELTADGRYVARRIGLPAGL